MPNVLVIVDDREDVRNSFARYFRRHFDQVRTASTPAEAEVELSNFPPPTHLVCDYWLGDAQPVGSVLIAKWKALYPTLQRAALVSGSELQEIACPQGVDAVFSKPADLVAMRKMLLL